MTSAIYFKNGKQLLQVLKICILYLISYFVLLLQCTCKNMKNQIFTGTEKIQYQKKLLQVHCKRSTKYDAIMTRETYFYHKISNLNHNINDLFQQHHHEIDIFFHRIGRGLTHCYCYFLWRAFTDNIAPSFWHYCRTSNTKNPNNIIIMHG